MGGTFVTPWRPVAAPCVAAPCVAVPCVPPIGRQCWLAGAAARAQGYGAAARAPGRIGVRGSRPPRGRRVGRGQRSEGQGEAKHRFGPQPRPRAGGEEDFAEQFELEEYEVEEFLQPGVAEYLEDVEYYASAGQWEEALQILERMPVGPNGHGPDVSSYNVALRAMERAGEAEAAFKLLEEMWTREADPDSASYEAAIGACLRAQDFSRAARLREDLRQLGPDPDAVRFQITPMWKWNVRMRRAGCGCRNTVDWKGGQPLPEAPAEGCWLLAAQDDMAEQLSEHRDELRQLGWRVPEVERPVVATMRDKFDFQELAARHGLTKHLPAFHMIPAEATYPCILKPARGTFGKDTRIVSSSEEVIRATRQDRIYQVERQVEQEAEYTNRYLEQAGQGYGDDDGSDPYDPFEDDWVERMEKVDEAVRLMVEEAEWEEMEPKWVLQELIPGRHEFSTTLLVDDGQILDVAGTRYEYGAEVYVWPHVELIKTEYVGVPGAHLDVFRPMLEGYSGILNFNYKLREDGSIAIFEINPRVGGDLVFDVPRPKARSFMEKFDAMLR